MAAASPPSPGSTAWTPPERPAWVQALNADAAFLDLPSLLPLGAEPLMEQARRSTGLEDFGAEPWLEAFRIFTRALEEEARLHLAGRLLTRAEMLRWLSNRLLMTDLWRRRPEVLEQPIEAPVFVCGLPRSGTSILYELLATDPRFRTPASWEALFPCDQLEAGGPAVDHPLLMAQGHGLVSQWAKIVPSYGTMHEMGGRIPCECGMIMAHTFNSDHQSSLFQVPSYHAHIAGSDQGPIYRYHRQVLQTLQQRRTGRWLLKAPSHLSFLPQLFAAYPDARVIQTHRDPLQCMASTTSLLGTLYWIRSDQPFEATQFEHLIRGEATAGRLDHVMEQRNTGTVPDHQFTDTLYQQLMDDPAATVAQLYAQLEMSFEPADRERVLDYLRHKPKGKFGSHQYELPGPEQVARERPLFSAYQTRFKVADEV